MVDAVGFPKNETRSFIQCPTGKESTGKDTDKAKCAKQIATSLQIPFETGVAQSDPRWYVDLLCLTIYCSSRNFHITPNGNCTCGNRNHCLSAILDQRFLCDYRFMCSRRSGAKGHFPSWHSCKPPLKQYFHQTLVRGFIFLHLIAFIAQNLLLRVSKAARL